MTKREMLCDLGYEDLIVFENPDYDSAIIGVSSDDRVIYDYDKMLMDLVVNDGMNIMDAADFISYNTIGAHSPEPDRDPIVMYRLPEIDMEG